MKIYSKLIPIILSIGVCTAQDIPDWISNIPDDDDHYYAVANVITINMSVQEYKAKANEQALIEISMQIKAIVSSTVEMSATETDDEISESFGMKSYTSTMAELEGTEKVGDYEMAGKYWVLWKLNKAMHQESMARHEKNAIEYYKNFVYMDADDPVSQLEALVPAYEAIVKVVGRPVPFDDPNNGQTVNLRTAVPNHIGRLLNELRLIPGGKTQFTGQAGMALAKPLKVAVKSSISESLGNIPIQFIFDSGEGQFSNDVISTDDKGRAKTEVSRIISRKKVQRVRAMIDLKEWREQRMVRSPSFEQHLDKISSKNSILFTLDVAQVTQEKIAVITVGDTSVYNESDYKRLNRSFRSEFSDVTDFKLKDEALIEGIIESYKRSANLCSNEECQIQIGKKLGVEKLIFIDVADYPRQSTITIFLRNIAENELEQEHTYSFDHRENVSKDKKLSTIIENSSYMVEDFWYRNNPGYLTMNCKDRGVKGEFKYLDPTEWMDKKFEKRLPMNGERFFEGTYELDINKLGYEKYHMRFEVAMGDFPEFDIALKAKRPGKAAVRSLFIPGRGQIYSSDVDHRGRFWMGLTYFVTTMACAGGSGYMWNEFFSARDMYEVSKADYQNAVVIDEIQATQAIMTSKHLIMSDKQNQAALLTGVTVGLWIFTTLDAYLFFPKEYKTRRMAFQVQSQVLAGEPAAMTGLRWTF